MKTLPAERKGTFLGRGLCISRKRTASNFLGVTNTHSAPSVDLPDFSPGTGCESGALPDLGGVDIQRTPGGRCGAHGTSEKLTMNNVPNFLIIEAKTKSGEKLKHSSGMG
jgi:hypothetical protein